MAFGMPVENFVKIRLGYSDDAEIAVKLDILAFGMPKSK